MNKREAKKLLKDLRGKVDSWPSQWGRPYPFTQADAEGLLEAGEKLALPEKVPANRLVLECYECGEPGIQGTLDPEGNFTCIACIPFPEE